MNAVAARREYRRGIPAWHGDPARSLTFTLRLLAYLFVASWVYAAFFHITRLADGVSFARLLTAAVAALPAVERLIGALLVNPALVKRPPDVVACLERIRTALEKAHSERTRFCFLAVFGDFTCAAEHEKRRGSFF